MNTMNLTQEEIKIINEYLSKVEDIPVVDCVYIISYFNKELESLVAELTTVINYYNEQDSNNINEELKNYYINIHNIINENNNNKERLIFKSDSEYNYTLSVMGYNDYRAEKKLLTGTILFDRMDRFKKNKKIADDLLTPYKGTYKIQNLDCVFNESNQKVLKKTI